jgi:hypothetical protein
MELIQRLYDGCRRVFKWVFKSFFFVFKSTLAASYASYVWSHQPLEPFLTFFGPWYVLAKEGNAEEQRVSGAHFNSSKTRA